jgi:hypothetical protein
MDMVTRDPARIETLRRAYGDRVRETKRLRDARRQFTSQLGLLPASGALVVGLFAAFSTEIDERLLALALIPFVVAVIVSALFSRLKPYRKIRQEIEAKEGKADWRLSEERWLVAMIKLEEQIYRELEWRLDRERWGAFAVQALVVFQIIYLIILASV